MIWGGGVVTGGGHRWLLPELQTTWVDPPTRSSSGLVTRLNLSLRVVGTLHMGGGGGGVFRYPLSHLTCCTSPLAHLGGFTAHDIISLCALQAQ